VVVKYQTSTDLEIWDPAAPDDVEYVLEGDMATETLRFNSAASERLFLQFTVEERP